MEKRTCPNCGEELPVESGFCPFCMTKLIEEKALPQMAIRNKRKLIFWMVSAVAVLIAVVICVIALTPNGGNGNNVESKSLMVWTMKLRPNGGVGAFDYCLENNIVGFGWGLDGNPKSVSEYRRIREQEGAYPGDEELNRTLDNFESMTSNDSNYVHLLWTQDYNDSYYICEMTGGYQYSRDDAHEETGIVNYAECNFYKIGSEDLVPYPAIQALNADGVIGIVHDSKAEEITRQLWLIAKEKNK